MQGRAGVSVIPSDIIDTTDDDDDSLTVSDLCKMFQDAEEASDEGRQLAERDRDFYDGKQLTEEELTELRKRGQPEVIINRIKRKIDYLVGLEKQQRTLPRGLPRTPQHEQDAHAVSDSLKYVADDQDYHSLRSGVWRNMLVEGTGACAVRVEQKPYKQPMGAGGSFGGQPMLPGPDLGMGGQPGPSMGAMQNEMMSTTAMSPPLQMEWCVKLVRYSWDRIFVDPHSSQLDCSDAAYLGSVVWMDEADAVAMYGEDSRDVLNATMDDVRLADTYDDTPKWMVWADKKRKRVRIVQIWIKRDEEWWFAEFTKGGILKSGPSPFVDENGKTECELIVQSSYIDRENNRYGVVREMISPQEEINKRRSKALHILNTNQMVFEEGAFSDEDAAFRESQKPNGRIKVNPTFFDKFKLETRTELATGQFELLKHATQEIDLMGPNAAMSGDQGKEASGRAILASQQGGMIEMGDLLDNLRHFDKRVFRANWSRIRQYWTAPKWVRVTDDERNVRFAAVNGAIGQDGRLGPPLAGLDVDIIIDDAPDGVAPQIEQFQSLVEAKKMDANGEIPFRVLLEAMPNLRNKEKLLAKMDEAQAQRQQQQGPPPEVAAMQAKMQLEQAKAQSDVEMKRAEIEIEAQRTQAQIMAERERATQEMALKRETAMLEMQLERERAGAQIEIERMKAGASLEIQREGMMMKAQQPQPEAHAA